MGATKKTARQKTVRPAWPVATEAQEQRIITDWLDARGIGYLPIPNRGQRSQDIRRAGAPDLVLTTRAREPTDMPPPLRPVAIEVKRSRGGVVSAAQQEVHAEMRREGWIVIIGAATHVIAEIERLRWGR